MAIFSAHSQSSYNLVYRQIYHHISINALSDDGHIAYLTSLACRTSVCHSGVCFVRQLQAPSVGACVWEGLMSVWESSVTPENNVAARRFLRGSIVVEGDMFSWGKACPVLSPPPTPQTLHPHSPIRFHTHAHPNPWDTTSYNNWNSSESSVPFSQFQIEDQYVLACKVRTLQVRTYMTST